MDSVDEADDRLETALQGQQARLPSNHAPSPLVLRPSPWRIVPLIVVCMAEFVVGLLAHTPFLIRAVSLPMLLPAIYLGVELVTHRVIITATSVSDVKARSTSDADGSHESYTILDGPPFPWLSWSRRQRPVAILWTGTDGSDHRLSFVWFRRKDAHAIIAGVHALQ